jgi:hypothetical protein
MFHFSTLERFCKHYHREEVFCVSHELDPSNDHHRNTQPQGPRAPACSLLVAHQHVLHIKHEQFKACIPLLSVSDSQRYLACAVVDLDHHSLLANAHASAMMRLLKSSPNGDLELISFSDNDLPAYAILSHTWTEGHKVTYNELVSGTGKEKTGYANICFCADRADEDGLEYYWVDTCCINKSNPQELQTAINSMFRWYQGASKCYVYLSDVQVPAEVTNAQDFRITWVEAFPKSRWFTRGWTLQELLAPASVEFFS